MDNIGHGGHTWGECPFVQRGEEVGYWIQTRQGESGRRPLSERSVTITTQETIAKIHDISMTDRRVTERYIATELGISQDRIHVVIHKELHMSKMSACCVPKLLGIDLNGSTCFLQRFVAIDEAVETPRMSA